MGNESSADKPKLKILLLGLPGAVKTSMLYKLKLGVIQHTVQTIGHESLVFSMNNGVPNNDKNCIFSCFDTNANRIRPLYTQHYEGTKALIWVVEAHDRYCIKESRDELHLIISDERLKDIVILIFANKQDLPNAISAEELQDQLDMTHYIGKSPEFLKSLVNVFHSAECVNGTKTI